VFENIFAHSWFIRVGACFQFCALVFEEIMADGLKFILFVEFDNVELL
jgi:hypothetical protein